MRADHFRQFIGPLALFLVEQALLIPENISPLVHLPFVRLLVSNSIADLTVMGIIVPKEGEAFGF
jgi:hypothetical protein